jgi:LysM repeat protein
VRRTLVFFVVGAALVWAGGARAQERSDLMNSAIPTQPAPPPGGAQSSGSYYPGMPIPQPTPAGERVPAGDGKGEARSPSGLFVPEGNSESVGVESSNGSPEAAPETHTVQRGDTLWDISAHYLGSPWNWPKLWSYNPAITNPHWIYPGDLVYLYPPGQTPPATAKGEPPPHHIVGGPRLAKGVFLRVDGFVEDGELKVAGKIVGSKLEKKMLSTLDEAYVEFPAEAPMQVGERYTVYMTVGEVKHPITHKKLGQKVLIHGEAEVRAVTDGHIARVAIIDCTEPIERGFFVGPLRRQFKIVEPRADAQNLRGIVVAVLQPRTMVANPELVFVDQGKAEGVEVGNRLLIVRRGDGYQPVLQPRPLDDPRFPPETLAEILVVETRDHLSTGIVTKSSIETRIGDRVEARQGY